MVDPVFNPVDATGNVSVDDALRAYGIQLTAATQSLYPNPRTLIWVNKPNLFEDLRAYAESHGIHDTFADTGLIQRLLSSRNPTDRAVADRLMTDSVMRTAMEISNRTDISDIANGFAQAMAPRNSPDAAQDQIEQLIDAAGPQHPIYNDMRRQYEELLERGGRNAQALASLRVNMARVRQQGYSDQIQADTIEVNIPAGYARYNIAGTEGNSHVIIGAPARNGQAARTTPIARGYVEGMEVQPTWYIPRSIAERKGMMDPAFIDQLRQQYVHSGATGRTYTFTGPDRETYTIDWTRLNEPGVSPFSQPPSPTNPLGAIKVMLGGRFRENSIRFHDTSAAARGDFTNYAQSSGCIRVQNIAEIAGLLASNQSLGQQNGYQNNRDFFAAMMQPADHVPGTHPVWQRPEFANRRIPVRPRIMVETTYHTVTWDPRTQRAVIHQDIYGYDREANITSRNAMPTFTTGLQQTDQQIGTVRAQTSPTLRYQG